MKSMERRLTILEKGTPQQSPELQERDKRVYERFNALVGAMDPQHARIVLDEVRLYSAWWTAELIRRRSGQRAVSTGWPPVLGRLARVALEMADDLESRPAALPPKVAKVYLEDADAMPLHECERCEYRVPVHSPVGRTSDEEAHGYFDRCPLCGGKTGYYARGHKLDGGQQRERRSRGAETLEPVD